MLYNKKINRFIIVMLSMFLNAKIFACSCLIEKIPNKNYVEIEIKNSNWIGVGRIIEETNDNFESRYKLEASKIYKGNQSKIQELISGPGNCGFVFQKNQEYLIYGTQKENGEIEVSYCSRTSRLDRTADLPLLDHYILKEEYSPELIDAEIEFLKNVMDTVLFDISEISLFFYQDELISKEEFFALYPVSTRYEARQFSAKDIKVISGEWREKARDGILIAGERHKRIRRRKLIRKVNRFFRKKKAYTN